MISKHPVLTALLGWLVPTVTLVLVLWLVPNITLRTASVGSFVGAEPRPGGNIWGNPATIVQTTRGTFVANGIFSAMRDEPLVVRDTSQVGLVVCAERPQATCAGLTGSFVGAFTPVPGAHAWLPRWFWAWSKPVAWIWGVIGALWFLLALASQTCDGDGR